jgi:hypothetical protein
MIEPFWDHTYKDKEAVSTFGSGQPSSEIVEIASQLDYGSSILKKVLKLMHLTYRKQGLKK